MLNFIINIFDIPLILVLVCLSFCSFFVIKNIYNLFLSLFISIFLIIFATTTILVQQVFLGEFIVIGVFLIFAILFFVFNLNKINRSTIEYKDDDISSYGKNLWKKTAIILSLLVMFAIVGLNFLKIDREKNDLLNRGENIIQIDENGNFVSEEVYNEYKENILLLNQNKLFQKLTHIIMFYICGIVIVYFYNKIKEEDEG